MTGTAWVFEESPLDVDWDICPYDTLMQMMGRY